MSKKIHHAHVAPISLGRIFLTLVGFVLFAGLAMRGYPSMKDYIKSLSVTYFQYSPTSALVDKSANTDEKIDAIAVPILIYHGVTEKLDDVNTTRENFVAHMEMLKKHGYKTISVTDFEKWLNNKIVLPNKSIIITFDDGRKDSFYPTDDILRKLGFKATLFEVTGKPDSNDHFYLSWDELKLLKNTGRWEIQAHGQYSHEKIFVDDKRSMGRFMSSRKWMNGDLESVEDFEFRIENDFLLSINDLKTHLEIDPKYYAIPLNEYEQKETSNYSEAAEFNNKMMKKYFKMAFIQTIVGDDVMDPKYDAFNYKDVDRYRVVRIEPMNSSAAALKRLLDMQQPKSMPLVLEKNNLSWKDNASLLMYGKIEDKDYGALVTNQSEYDIGRILFGYKNWNNYIVKTSLERTRGRSAGVMIYYLDDKNYIWFGMSDGGIALREKYRGEERNLAPEIVDPKLVKGVHALWLSVKNKRLDAYIDGKKIYGGIDIQGSEGRVGLSIWDDKSMGEVKYMNLSVEPKL